MHIIWGTFNIEYCNIVVCFIPGWNQSINCNHSLTRSIEIHWVTTYGQYQPQYQYLLYVLPAWQSVSVNVHAISLHPPYPHFIPPRLYSSTSPTPPVAQWQFWPLQQVLDDKMLKHIMLLVTLESPWCYLMCVFPGTTCSCPGRACCIPRPYVSRALCHHGTARIRDQWTWPEEGIYRTVTNMCNFMTFVDWNIVLICWLSPSFFFYINIYLFIEVYNTHNAG